MKKLHLIHKHLKRNKTGLARTKANSFEVLTLGVMTGTSADGADFVLVRNQITRDGTKESLLFSKSRIFPDALRREILEAQKGELSLREFGLLQRNYSVWLAHQISNILSPRKLPKIAKGKPILLGIHGQTVWHEPKSGFSIQMLDGVLVQALTGFTVVHQFRQADLALGGEGAPLVPYYHWLRLTEALKSSQLPFSIHNLGGMSNLSLIFKHKKDVRGFDVGPGNVLIDLAVAKASKDAQRFDNQGALARVGRIDWLMLEKVLGKDPYFKMLGPKSTGREIFNEAYLERLNSKVRLNANHLEENAYDLIAQATAFTALTIVRTYERLLNSAQIKKLHGVSFCGGGAKNLFLMELIRKLFSESKNPKLQAIRMISIDKILGDAQDIEAMAFARFALEAVRGNSIALPKVTGADQESAAASIVPGNDFTQLLLALRGVTSRKNS